MRALISVYDKSGVAEFARGLAELGFELVSSGGTADHLAGEGIEVTRVEDVTQAPEMLGGRVKTLHPRIHAGILARRNRQEDVDTLAADRVSAFGSVIVLNRAVTAKLGARIAEHFVEVLLAPAYEDAALDALRVKEALRILCDHERRAETPHELDYKRVLGGLLVQERDADAGPAEPLRVVAGSVSDEQKRDLLFAWQVCRFVSSNAIVLARERQTIGIGAGQMSRVDAVRIALEKARELGHDPAGAVLASDAFFPFADGPQLALEAGVTALIQPGGSKRDAEVVEAVEAAGAAMVFTGRRHFRH